MIGFVIITVIFLIFAVVYIYKTPNNVPRIKSDNKIISVEEQVKETDNTESTSFIEYVFYGLSIISLFGIVLNTGNITNMAICFLSAVFNMFSAQIIMWLRKIYNRIK